MSPRCLTATARRHTQQHRRVGEALGLGALFGWCIEEGWLPGGNPVDGTRKPQRAAARERVLSDHELRAIWNACGDDDHGRIVRLLILTGARRQEVGGMCWSELDLPTGDDEFAKVPNHVDSPRVAIKEPAQPLHHVAAGRARHHQQRAAPQMR